MSKRCYNPVLDGPEPLAPELSREEHLEQQADVDHASGARSVLLDGIDSVLRDLRPPTRLHSGGTVNGASCTVRDDCQSVGH